MAVRGEDGQILAKGLLHLIKLKQKKYSALNQGHTQDIRVQSKARAYP